MLGNSATRPQHNDGGFALVLVIWGIGLISLVLLASIAAARWRIMAAANSAAAVQTAQLAESGAMIAVMRLVSGNTGNGGAAIAVDGRPAFCGLPGGAKAALVIEDEGGKVDLNGASPKLLQALFSGFGMDTDLSADVARAIVDYRTVSTVVAAAPPGPGSAIAPKHGLFQTIFELDQVAAVPPGFAREMAPYLTVASARAGLDPMVAPPALFAALSGAGLGDVQTLAATPNPNRLDRSDPRFPLTFIQGSSGGVYLVHAEAMMASGVLAVRERLVDVRPGQRGGHRVLERRTAPARYGAELRGLLKAGAAAVPEC